MSPDRTTITRAEAIRKRRAEEIESKLAQTEKTALKNAATKKLETHGANSGFFGSFKNPFGKFSFPKSNTHQVPGVSSERKKQTAENQFVTSTPTHLTPGFFPERDVTTPDLQRGRLGSGVTQNIPNPLGGRPSQSSGDRRSSTSREASSQKHPEVSIHAPKLHFGARWFSFLIALFCSIDLYIMLNIDPFIVQSAIITGNQRVSTPEIENVLGVFNNPAAMLNPAQIQMNILAAYPDISSAQVEVTYLNKVVINITERTPVAAWKQDNQTVWVDVYGYAFPPRGKYDGLLNITATGAPALPNKEIVTIGAKPFLPTEMFQTIDTITPYIPQGAALIYDPQFGLGWNDPQGWKVYFGLANGDNSLKIKVYQNMLDYLSKKKIKPLLISVEYPNAPFYRVEQ